MPAPPGPTDRIALIDGIGPFFRNLRPGQINWSKIPFEDLVTDGPEREAFWNAVCGEMETFACRVVGLGFDAVTLDDVAHLSDHPWLEPDIRARNSILRDEFHRIVSLLRERGLRIYMTADFLTTTEAVDDRLRDHVGRATAWFVEVLEGFLEEFPDVDGVILRIGESDGLDVSDPLRSRLLIRSARQVNRLLRAILPVFEQRNRRLIFRTWTVGAHLIGDLIWHRGRLADALRGIDSPAFVLSMKYGESDFFRYLPLNRHFFRVDLPKIIELQARREYEGAGEYPSFIGWDCLETARQLRDARNVIGFSVWCQTGGWHAFRRRAFLDPDAKWIELNAAVAARVFREGATVEQAVSQFFEPEQVSGLLEFLRLADQVVLRVLYIEEFAQRKLFFRRVRIPPLLHVYWDSIFINDAVRRVISDFVQDPEQAVRDGESAFENFDRMLELAHDYDLPVEDLEFMRDTFAIVLLARRYYLLQPDPELIVEIKSAKKAYKQRWPRSHRQRYRIRIDAEMSRLNRRTLTWLLQLFVRQQRGYRRVLDRVFGLHVLSWIYRLFHARNQKALPKFLRKTAMGFDQLFR